MIRFAVAMITLIVLNGWLAFAQDATPKVQVFGGYSLLHADLGGLNNAILDTDLHQTNAPFGLATNFNGWNVEAQYNADRWVGAVVDFGGRYGSPITAASGATASGIPNGNGYSFLAGPVISYRAKSRLIPFAHLLAGWDRTSLSASTITGTPVPVSSAATAYTDFAIALGGGLDYKIWRRLALRLAQVDRYHTSLNLNKFYGSAFGVGLFEGLATHQDNWRVSAGAVLQF